MTWRDRIVEARANGQFTPQDAEDASSWETCAVGEARLAHPTLIRTTTPYYFAPLDADLAQWGIAFGRAVRHGGLFETAETCLDAIEDRVLVLKRTPHEEPLDGETAPR
jgi:hypothetical protein